MFGILFFLLLLEAISQMHLLYWGLQDCTLIYTKFNFTLLSHPSILVIFRQSFSDNTLTASWKCFFLVTCIFQALRKACVGILILMTGSECVTGWHTNEFTTFLWLLICNVKQCLELCAMWPIWITAHFLLTPPSNQTSAVLFIVFLL